MKEYSKSLKWACIYFVDRKTQDDNRDKLHVIGLFENPVIIQDCFISNLPNQETCKRYIVHVDDLEEIEQFYNDIQDLKEQYNNYWIYHIKDLNYHVDQENKYRTILNLWTN